MKRLPINDQERQFIKSIQTTAVVYLLMFRIYPTPLNSDALAFEMKWDKRKSKKMLDDLSSDGFTALIKGQGYILTSQARGMVLEFLGDQIALPIEAQALAQESQAQAHEALEGKVIIPENSAHGARALVEESLTTEFKDLSTTSLESAHFVQWPSSEKIIAATPILFGEPGVFRGKLPLDDLSPKYMLGVLAHCYDMRQTRDNPKGIVHRPASLAYSMMLEDKQPRDMYLRAPMDYLPDEYLAVLGLVQLTCGSCGEKFSKLEGLQAHEVAMHAEAETPAELTAVEPVTPAAVIMDPEEPSATAEIEQVDTKAEAQALWEQVQDQLKLEMPRASFSNWVRPAKAIKYDGQVLTVVAHDQYDREWLENRLTSIINRLLIGILNADVTVEFIIAQKGGE